MDLMQWTEIHCNPHHERSNSMGWQQQQHHPHVMSHPMNAMPMNNPHLPNFHHHPNHPHHPLNHHHHHHHPQEAHHHLSSAPTIKNHSVTHFGGYLYCFGGYDGRRNHMTLLIYSIAEQRWIRPVNTASAAAAPPQGGPPPVLEGYPNVASAAGVPGADPHAFAPQQQQQHPPPPLNHHHHPPQQQQQQQHQHPPPLPQRLPHNNNMLPMHAAAAAEGGGGSARMGGAGGGNGPEAAAGDMMMMQMMMEGAAFPDANPEAEALENGAPPALAAAAAASNNNNSNNNPPPPLSSSPIWVSGTYPPGRNGHSATLVTDEDDGEDEQHPESGRIFILGGWLGTGPLAASDMHVLDISRGGRQLRWYQPAVKGTPPGACNMHSADYVKSQKQIYVFRGGNGREYLNDVHALNVDTLMWRRVETTGAIPQQRANHSSAILGDELFIFGGWNGTERLNDIHVLDTRTNTWTCPHVGGVLPHPRAGMTLTALRGRLYLFGGSGTSAKCFSDLQIFDRAKMSWLDCTTEQEQNKSTSSVVGPSAHRYEEGSYAMPQQYDESGQQPFGGYSDQSMGDGDPWRNRARHQQNQVINPNDEDSVPSVLVQGRGPGRRAGHTATAVNRKIYVFGGSCGADYLNDFFLLDTDPPPRAVVTESNSLELMERRLHHFFNDEEFADVIFLVQGQRVYGHKMVLSIVSECFRAMFSSGSGFRESAEAEIVIPDCSHAAFLALMEYIYMGRIPKSLGLADPQSNQLSLASSRSSSSVVSESPLESAGSGGAVAPNNSVNNSLDSSQLSRLVELLELADRFFLDHLKQVCETLLQGAVNADTVEYLTSIAQKTNSTQLMEICNHFSRNRE